MGLFDKLLRDSVPASKLSQSGEQEVKYRSGVVPKVWDDGVDDAETTGETEAGPPSMRARLSPHLMIMTGPSAGKLIPVDGSVVIGRSRGADLQVEDNGVSRRHCRIARQGNKVIVEDLESRNGTIVNGTKVMRAVLEAGDRLQLGPELIVQLSMYDDREQTLARKLFESSTRDPLTSAFNRQYFGDRIEAEMAHARRHNTNLSVLMIDLDGLRAINDAHGRAVGDEVLRSVVETIERTVRTEDLFCRYGGDELALLIREPLAAATRTAERIRSRVESSRVSVNRKHVQITASIGVAEIGEPGAQLTGEGLVAVAEKRLHRAKLMGKNQVCAE